MRKLVIYGFILSLSFACSEQINEPELSLVEKLERFLEENNQTILDDAPYPSQSNNGRTSSEPNIKESLTFELHDSIVLEGIEQLLRDYGYTNVDLENHLKFFEQNNGRINGCKTVWHFYFFEDGSGELYTCSDCYTSDGSFECMLTHLH